MIPEYLINVGLFIEHPLVKLGLAIGCILFIAWCLIARREYR